MSGYVSGFDHHKIVSQFTKLLKEDKLTTSNTETQSSQNNPFSYWWPLGKLCMQPEVNGEHTEPNWQSSGVRALDAHTHQTATQWH